MVERFAPSRHKDPRRKTTLLLRSLHVFALSLIMAWLGILALIAPEIADRLP